MIVLLAGVGLSHAANAAFELYAPDGRRILLRDNGTWEYVDTKTQGAASKTDERALVVRLASRTDRGNNCRFGIQLTNELPYEIRSIVLYYSAYRANGVMYDSVSSESGPSKPGNAQVREIEFLGIRCQDIVRVEVGGGDHCEMGNLTRFSYERGECLARVRAVPSDLVRFDK
jgi:hypothetical protein